MWQGGGVGYKNIVMVTLGTGVGGVVINSKVIAGATGAGGEIGHINVNNEDKTVCGCGNTCCLELFSSATGVVRNTKRYLERGMLIPSISTFIDICNALGTSSDIILASYIQANTQIRWSALADKLGELSQEKQDKIQTILECLIDTI